jgi:signal transduction histidine kinase
MHVTPASQPRAAPDVSDTVAQLVVEHSSEIVFTLDSAGLVRAANAAALTTLGHVSDHLIGALWLDLLDPGSRAKGLALLDAGARGQAGTFELNHVDAARTIVMVAYRAIPLPVPPDSPASAPHTLLLGRPLATAIAATERLVGLNRRLSALFAIAAVAARALRPAEMLDEVLRLLLADLDAGSGMVWLSEAPIELAHAGAPAGELRLAAQRGLSPAADPARVQTWPSALRAYLRRGEPFTLDTNELEQAQSELGWPLGPLATMLAVPIRSERQLIGWLCVIAERYQPFGQQALDLTSSIGALLGPPLARARLVDQLVETSGQLGAVLDSIDSGVLLIDLAGTIRYANRRLGELLGADVSGWPGQTRAALIDHLLAPLDEAGRLFDQPLLVTIGEQRRVLRRFSDQIADAAGTPAGLIEVYSDVSQIHQMDRLKDEFIAAAAHDLKTPVTAVKGYTQIALRLAQHLDEQRLVASLEMINARSSDLAYLMDTLLDMSRIQAGRLRLELEQANLSELVARAVRHFTLDMQRQRRTIAVELPEAPVEVQWDIPRIERVLINLIGNALKYSPEGGDVLVRARPRAAEDAIELSVTDSGIGIAPDEREQIFERFYRARQTVAEGFKGSGLGLYICRSVVDAHSGQIWAADALHGSPGTTIFAVLPRVVEDDELDEL